MFFRDIPGQAELKKQLNGMALSGRIPHALLFAERKVSGGLLLAIAFARRLLCNTPDGSDGCGKCKSCLQFNSLAHPDLVMSYPIVLQNKDDDSEVYLESWRSALLENAYLSHEEWLVHLGTKSKNSLIPVEEASRLLRICSMKRFISDYRVVLIWLPERMNSATANKLLKLIEEPQEGTLFFLLSQRPDHLLPTIISRCQLLSLEHANEDLITQFLVSHNKVDLPLAQLSARFAEGDLNLAIRMANTDRSLDRFSDWFVRWTRICYAVKLNDLLDWCSELSKAGKDELQAYLRFTASILEESLRVRQSMVVFNHPAFQNVDFKMQVFSKLVSTKALEKMINRLDDSLISLGQNAHSKLILFQLGVEMMRSFKTKE